MYLYKCIYVHFVYCVFTDFYQSIRVLCTFQLVMLFYLMLYILEDFNKAFVSLAKCCNVELYLLVCFYF